MTTLFYKNFSISALTLTCFLLFTDISHATLIDRGNGLIYDDVQNITWLQDANYSKTSGYDADGLMNWEDANTWATGLVFQGSSDWRLFTRDLFDTNCTDPFPDASGHTFGYNCTGSELGYLYYNYFGLEADDGLNPLATDSAGIANMNLFANLQNANYWDGTLPKSTNIEYWDFSLEYGDIISDFEWNENYAWAVADGDIAAANPVPEPETGVLFMISLLVFFLAKRRVSLQNLQA